LAKFCSKKSIFTKFEQHPILKTILFVSHDANRAGAQIVLLQLIRQLRLCQVPMCLLLCGDGPLEAEFQAETTVIKLPKLKKQLWGNTPDRLLNMLGVLSKLQQKDYENQFQQFENKLLSLDIGLVFLNTIATATYYPQIEFLKTPVVLFAHELEMSVKMYSQPHELRRVLQHTNHLLVVAQALANFYATNYDFPRQDISIFTLIEIEPILQKIEAGRQAKIRQQLNIPANAIVIGGCGNAELRKGNDLFLILAQMVLKKYPENVYFMWVGLREDSELFALQMFDIQRLGLQDKIFLVEPTSQVFDYTTQFDIFALTSREDPYPLVALEAALNETPIVCFAQSGGIPELVQADAGVVVPYLDMEAMSSEIGTLIDDVAKRKTLGKTAQKRVLEIHNTEQSVAKITQILQQVSAEQNLFNKKTV
jgi:glycosyltransferase involved in cell wall biosynthesis